MTWVRPRVRAERGRPDGPGLLANQTAFPKSTRENAADLAYPDASGSRLVRWYAPRGSGRPRLTGGRTPPEQSVEIIWAEASLMCMRRCRLA